MGGCVSFVMDSRNKGSITKHNIIAGYRAYGTEADIVTTTKSAQKADESPVYRLTRTSDVEHAALQKSYYYDDNWVRSLQKRATEIPDRPAVGYRELEKIEKRVVTDEHTGKQKTLEYYHCSPYRTITYNNLWRKMEHFGRGLTVLGVKRGATVSIYEETRWEWITTMYGIWLQDMVASTVYANLGEDALIYALAETQSAAIVCNAKGVPVLMRLLRDKPHKPLLIYLDELPAGTRLPTEGQHEGFTIVPWLSVVKKGAEAAATTPIHIPTDPDVTALVMYTSGTTGNPKGVMHSHGSIAAGIRSLNHRLLDLYRSNEDGEIYCAYLPMAHILEFALVNIFLVRGTMVGFGSPRTLTDAFCIPHGDLREFKPQVVIAVPRIFDTIRKSVEAKLPKPGTFKRTIFEKAYASRRAAILEGQDTPYWNSTVFGTVNAMLGGNIYGMLSGGGPLSPSTQEFINVMCGGPLIIQGWGLTETICCGATQRLGDLEPNCVGQILKGLDMKLKDVGEEFKHTDTPEPRGEICLRGPFLFKGYYKQPELTKEALDEDGWFHTGDVGSITKEGKVRLVGRVKALAKNVLGEYIALETLEAIYGNNPLAVINGVCVLVHPEKAFIAALVLTDKGRVEKFVEANNITNYASVGYPAILKDKKFLAAAATSMAATAQEAGRQKFEHVTRVRVLNDEWTPENGLVTPTSKLRRSMIDKHYKELIAEIFD